jgi:Uma2 family endonuclease
MSRSATLAVGLSVDEFMAYDTPDGKAELVRGELRVTPPPGAGHGGVIVELIVRLKTYVDAHKLGRVLTNVGFELLQLPRTVRAPDVSFVRQDRLPVGGLGAGLLRLAPDLAVEVVSPSETRALRAEKLDDYRDSSVPLAWVIDPTTRTVMIVEGNLARRVLVEGDSFDGGVVIPDFSCRVSDLFEGLAR